MNCQVTIYKCLQHHNKSITINLTISTVVTVMIWFPLFVHVCACLWYFIATCEEASQSKSSWIYGSNVIFVIVIITASCHLRRS